MFSPGRFTYDDSDREVSVSPSDLFEHQAKEILEDNVFILFRVIRVKHHITIEAFSYSYMHLDRVLFYLVSMVISDVWHLLLQRKYF